MSLLAFTSGFFLKYSKNKSLNLIPVEINSPLLKNFILSPPKAIIPLHYKIFTSLMRSEQALREAAGLEQGEAQ